MTQNPLQNQIIRRFLLLFSGGFCVVVGISLFLQQMNLAFSALTGVIVASFIYFFLTYIVIDLYVLKLIQKFSGIADEIVDGNLELEIPEIPEGEFSRLNSSLRQLQETLKIQRDQIGAYLQKLGEVNQELSGKVESLSLLADAGKIFGQTLDLDMKLNDFIKLLSGKTVFKKIVVYIFKKDSQLFTLMNPGGLSHLPPVLEHSDPMADLFSQKGLKRVGDSPIKDLTARIPFPYVMTVGSEFNPLAIFFLEHQGAIPENIGLTLDILAAAAAPSISNSFLFENSEATKNQLDQKVFNLMSIQQSGKILSSTLDIEKLLQLSLDMFLETVWANKGLLMLYDQDNKQMVVRCFKGMSDDELGVTLNNPSEILLLEELCQSRLPLIVGDFHSAAMPVSSFKTIPKGEFHLYIPLLKEDSIYGAFMVGAKINEQPFSDNDLDFLFTLSSQAVIAFENARLYSLAITDGMTKLYLHRYFQMRMDEEISRSLRYKTPLTLMMCDIDKFKSINDNFGHQQGDIILIEVAKIIKKSIRATDIASRYGGEEFAIILPETGNNEAHIVAERIRSEVEATAFPDLSGAHFRPGQPVTISIGVASVPYNATVKESLIQKADNALYEAKEKGRNAVVVSAHPDGGELGAANWKSVGRGGRPPKESGKTVVVKESEGTPPIN